MAVENKHIYYCVGCGIIHPKGNFYVSYNSSHKNGRLPFCKDYIKKKVYKTEDKNNNKIDMNRFQNILRQLDIPFLKDTFESAALRGGDVAGHYFTMFNSLPQNRGLTWVNSVFLNENDDREPKVKEEKTAIAAIEHSDEDIKIAKKRWGDTYDNNQLEQLERFYKKMYDANNIETPQDEIYLEKLALISLKMDEELEKANYSQAKQLGDLFSKYMADSQFRAVDKTDSDKQGGIRTFGSIYAEVERDDHIPPWEYYRKVKGLTQDILDKTIMHIENFTLKFNKAETMITPPSDTPKAMIDELDLDSEGVGDD